MKTSNLRILYTNKTSIILAITLIIIAIVAFINTPVTSAQTVITTSTSTIPLCEITRSLTIGSSGEDVKCLQRYLNWAGFPVATTGSGSPGNESTYFGSLTANAVTRWQNANYSKVLMPAGLTFGTGYFGPLSFKGYVNVVMVQLGLAVQ